MPLYLYQVAYTPESWKVQIERQENVADRISPTVKQLGGRIVDCFYAFGEYDFISLVEMPSDEAMAAAALTFAAGGSLKATKTTKLLTVEAGIEAMKMASAAASAYTAPIPQGTVRETVAH